MLNQSGSRRWEHFQSAIQLAVQRCSHKWSYEDFSECFPLYTQEDKNASQPFNTISDYIEAQALRDVEKIIEIHAVRKNIDISHNTVTESKERKKAGIEPGNDTWTEDLDTRSRVAARAVPILEQEAQRLRELYAGYEASNAELEAEMSATAKASDDADERLEILLKQLREVLEEWKNVPSEAEEWTVGTTENSIPPSHG